MSHVVTVAHLRYSFGGYRPSKTTKHARLDAGIVPNGLSLGVEFGIIHLPSTYTEEVRRHCKLIVKEHGVLPSYQEDSASSQRVQIRRVSLRDSRTVVAPFMLDPNYVAKELRYT